MKSSILKIKYKWADNYISIFWLLDMQNNNNSKNVENASLFFRFQIHHAEWIFIGHILVHDPKC